MNSRLRLAGAVAFVFFVAATAGHAQSADSVVARNGPIPGRAGIGGQIGSSWIFSGGDYSSGSQPRFSFVGHFRYVLSKHWGWQVSPSFTWNGYVSHVNAPYQDLNFPNEGVSKEFYLTQVIGAAGEIQYFGGPTRKRWHIGAGPAIYRVVLENHRMVLKDPVSLELHKTRHLGFEAEYGTERFLHKLPNTSIEVTAAYTQVWAKDNVKWVSGWNGIPRLLELRVGAHYYYDFRRAKPKSTKPGLGN